MTDIKIFISMLPNVAVSGPVVIQCRNVPVTS